MSMRGTKMPGGRKGHKRGSKRTFKGRFVPLEDPAKYLPPTVNHKTKDFESVAELFNSK